MKYRYQKHYTREEARQLLPQLRAWLAELNRRRGEIEKLEQRLQTLAPAGEDTGGGLVNTWIRALAAMQSVLAEFHQREILIKDVERGLVDFPAIIGGREVFLCWETEEEDIEFWHDLESGVAGRERLD